MVLPSNNNIVVTRSGSIDSVNSDVSIQQNVPFKQKANPGQQLGVNFQRDRGAPMGSNEHSRLAGNFNQQIDGLISGLHMKTTSGRGQKFTNLLFHNRYEFSSTSLKAMTKTMERLGTGSDQAKSDLKTLEKDLLKVKAGKTGIRAFGLKRGARAMALRQEIRNATLITYLKTGDMKLAKQVKQNMIEALTQKQPGGNGKSEFEQIVNAKSSNELKQLDLSFNDVAGFVETATPGELRAALANGSLANQDLNPKPDQPQVNQGGPPSNVSQVDLQLEPGGNVNLQVKNDELIAKQFDNNHKDLDDLTKGNIKPENFVTKGGNNGVQDNHEIVDTSSDELIAQEFYRNQLDLKNLTNGNIKREDFKTKGNDDVNEGQVDQSIVDTSSDELISQEFYRNQVDLNNLTQGNIKHDEFNTGKGGEND